MKKYLVFAFFIVANCIFSQAITLRVLGQHSYSDQSEAYVANITIEENPNKCDPIKGFISIEEQQKHLMELIAANGSKSTLIPIKDFTYSEYRKKSFIIEEPDSEIFDDILTSCNNLQVKVNKTYYKLPEHDFIEEDQKAILALHDARAKANVISSHIKYKVNKLLNIDDDTSDASQLFDLSGYDPEVVKLYMEILGRADSSGMKKNESKSSSRKGRYNLWVTYELIPI